MRQKESFGGNGVDNWILSSVAVSAPAARHDEISHLKNEIRNAEIRNEMDVRDLRDSNIQDLKDAGVSQYKRDVEDIEAGDGVDRRNDDDRHASDLNTLLARHVKDLNDAETRHTKYHNDAKAHRIAELGSAETLHVKDLENAKAHRAKDLDSRQDFERDLKKVKSDSDIAVAEALRAYKQSQIAFMPQGMRTIFAEIQPSEIRFRLYLAN